MCPEAVIAPLGPYSKLIEKLTVFMDKLKGAYRVLKSTEMAEKVWGIWTSEVKKYVGLNSMFSSVGTMLRFDRQKAIFCGRSQRSKSNVV